MHGVPGGDHLATSNGTEAERITAHMDAGDSIRRQTNRNDAVAALAVGWICDFREREHDGREVLNTAFVLNSLKHPAEVHTLRRIYRDRFVLISVHSPAEIRLSRLKEKIARSADSPETPDRFDGAAREIMDRDEWDERKAWGQRVRDAFTEADAYVSTNPTTALESGISRFLQLYFGNPFITPTRDEYAMFHAHAAALRSSDLSRQVGAAISNLEGDVISVGCNEVPKAGGGEYWEEDCPDSRDFQLGYDSNARAREAAFSEAAEMLSSTLGVEVDSETVTTALANSRLSNITEFGRPVHAEMAAILDATRRGATPTGCRLFTTTFPCHNCARHIIDAGLVEVIYREPYEKSLAANLHADSIEIDPEDPDRKRVVFRRYTGIGPPRYFDFFSAGKRKDHAGKRFEWEASKSTPRAISTDAYRPNESNLLAALDETGLGSIRLDEGGNG